MVNGIAIAVFLILSYPLIEFNGEKDPFTLNR